MKAASRLRVSSSVIWPSASKTDPARATISRRAGLPSVQITDEAAIPSQLCKTTVAPDKAAIKAQLLAGETVPGAQIVMGADGVTVRVR